ncbi:MAG: S8 family serine peptidase, partial [Candidatus Promineofilum sp.]|nr:S8 family serine peptidase [Promineifilum sp.]
MDSKLKRAAVVAFLCVVGLLGLRPAPAAIANSVAGTPGEWIGGLVAPRLSSHVLVELATDPASAGLSGRVDPIFGRWYRLYPAPAQSIDSLLAVEAANPAVLRAEPDYLLTADAAPDDPLYLRQWHMPQVQVEEAWGVTTGDGVVVAVLDSGVDPHGADGFCHPLYAEYNVVGNATGPGAALDDYNHGTHVAGTVAGCAGNATGVVGLAYDANIMAVKVLTNGTGSNADVAEGIVWAADHGAQVINMSLGSGCSSAWPACSVGVVNAAIDYAAAHDIVIVVSAGNHNRATLGFPGNHPEVIGVMATRYNQTRASYSNYGPAVDMAAPGGQSSQDQNQDGFPDGVLQETFVRSSSPHNWQYSYFQGTSMAAPHVTGAAVLLRACAPEADRDEVRAALEGYALDLGQPGFDNTYGHGFLQTYDALAGLAYGTGRDPADHCAPTAEPPPCFSVSAVADGPGVVNVAPPPNCDPDGGDPAEPTAYHFGTVLTFSADPDPGNVFTGWSGDLSGDSPAQPLRVTRDLAVTAGFAPPPPEPTVAFSLKANGTAAGLAFADEDVLLDEPGQALARLFKGADHGLAEKDIDALAILGDGSLLISLDGPANSLPGLMGIKIDDSDIVRYAPSTGLYGWYFDGSDVGLTTAAEDIDAIALLPDGRLLLST